MRGPLSAGQSPHSLVDGIDVCTVVKLAQHSTAPYCRGGSGDGVVLDDLLLGADGGGTSCWATLRTEVPLGLFLHSSDGTVLVCQQELFELCHLILQHGHLILQLHVGLGELLCFLL